MPLSRCREAQPSPPKRLTTYTAPPPIVINAPALRAPEVRPRGSEWPLRCTASRQSRHNGDVPGATLPALFQIDIPIQADADILPFDLNTLAIFKWRLSKIPPANRWYPVLKRYIDILSARIDGLGGDAGSIQPSPTDLPGPTGSR